MQWSRWFAWSGVAAFALGTLGCSPEGSGSIADPDAGSTPFELSAAPRASVQAAFVASQQARGAGDVAYHFRAEGGAAVAFHRGYALRGSASEAGMGLSVGQGVPDVVLRTERLGCEDELRDVERVSPRSEANRIEYRRGDVTEWWLNGPLGLEQGFTLHRAPCQAPSELRFEIAVEGLRPELDAQGASVKLVDDAGLPALRYQDAFAHDADGQPLGAKLSVVDERIVIAVDAVGARYPVVVDPLVVTEQARFVPEYTGDGQPNFRFGLDVAISGNSALIGTQGQAAYVYVRSGTTWSEQARLLSSESAGSFGRSVAILGDTALVGARNDSTVSTDRGSAYVFVRTGTSWTEQQKLLASDGGGGHQLGYRVALGTDTALVSTIAINGGAGAGYVFARTGTTWTQQQKLTASDGAANDWFGAAVGLSGNTALLGASGDDDAGASSGTAYVFVRTGTTWTQQQKLSGAGLLAGDGFGNAVGLDGNTALIGAAGDDTKGSNAGAAYVFVRSGTTWAQQTKIVASDGGTDDAFGSGVALSGNTGTIGAPGNISAYVYTRSGTTWSFQQQVVPTGAANGSFGRVLALDGATLVAGASDEDTGAVYFFFNPSSSFALQDKATLQAANSAQLGEAVAVEGTTAVAGAPNDSSTGTSQGVALVYARTGTTWAEQAKLVASDGASGDRFGTAVSLSGSTVFVGTPYDDVGGLNSGSVYVFVRSGTVWSQQTMLAASDGALNDWFGRAVSLSGDTALVGADGEDEKASEAGAAYVFVRSGTSWSQQQKLLAPDGAASDSFGSAVAVDGDTALVGMYRDDDKGSSSGSVWIFARSGTTWSAQTKLVPIDLAADHDFGYAVDLDGTVAVVGARQRNGSGAGAAYVYSRSGTTWTQDAKLTASDGVTFDQFGSAVAIRSGVIGVGADDDTVGSNSAQGSAYLFLRSGTSWQEAAHVFPSAGAPSDSFGYSIDVDGSVIVGAPLGRDQAVSDAGNVYLFGVTGYTGDACSTGTTCASGFCVDAVCCNTACGGACDVCSQAKGASVNGQCTILGPSFPGEPACAPQTCNGSSAVCSDCLNDAQCPSGKYCDAAGKCQTKKTQGTACSPTAGADCKENGCAVCASAGGCVDGYCCNTACSAACDVCSTALGASANGTCATAPSGTNTAACPAPAACNGTSTSCPSGCSSDSECAANYYCDSTGQCALRKGLGAACNPQAGQNCLQAGCRVCQSNNCVDGYCCNSACAGSCDRCDVSTSLGTCSAAADGSTPSPGCNGYLCDGSSTSCPTTCATDADCAGTHYCSGNACVSKKAQGSTCSAANECSTGFCADGVCCNSACDAVCMACSAANKQSGTSSGTCDVAKQGTNPNNKCVVDSSNPCGQVASCKGSAAECAVAPFGKACGPTSCNGGSVNGKVCDGTGTCVDQSNASCAPYVCAGGACTTPCTADTDCVSGYFCSSGTCVAKSDNGLGCSAAKECKSSFCVDGVCCDAPCGGQCQACDVTGSIGQCKTVTGAPHGTRPACSGTGACQGTCNGTDPTVCSFPGSATTCAAASCVGDVSQPAGACDSTGSCAVPATKACAPYGCDASSGACKASCTSAADCSQGATCDTLSGQCTTGSATCQDAYTVKLANGQTQSCAPYKCVGGACQQQCAVSGDCAPGYTCQGTACVADSDAGTGGAGTGGGGTGGTTPAGGTGGITTGGASGSGTGGSPSSSSGGDDGGCGCRLPAGGSDGRSALLLIAALGLSLRRRRAS